MITATPAPTAAALPTPTSGDAIPSPTIAPHRPPASTPSSTVLIISFFTRLPSSPHRRRPDLNQRVWRTSFKPSKRWSKPRVGLAVRARTRGHAVIVVVGEHHESVAHLEPCRRRAEGACLDCHDAVIRPLPFALDLDGGNACGNTQDLTRHVCRVLALPARDGDDPPKQHGRARGELVFDRRLSAAAARHRWRDGRDGCDKAGKHNQQGAIHRPLPRADTRHAARRLHPDVRRHLPPWTVERTPALPKY